MGKKKNNKKVPDQSEDLNTAPNPSEDVSVDPEIIPNSVALEPPIELQIEETKDNKIDQKSKEKSDTQQIDFQIVNVEDKVDLGYLLEQSAVRETELCAQLQDKNEQIKDLNADRQIMQSLLEKSQEENEELSQNLKLFQENFKQSEVKVKELENKIQEIQNQKLQRSQVQQIVARVKVGELGYTLIKTQQNKTEWYQDSTIINIQEQLASDYKACSQVNYSTVFSEIKSLEKNLADCMHQYEERLTRVNNFMEESNQTYLKTQEELKQVRLKQEADMRGRDSFITNLIDRSQTLKQIIMKVKGRDCLNQIELNLGKLMELKPADTICTELRDHILDVYQRVILSQLKTIIKTEDNLHSSKEALGLANEKIVQTDQQQREYISKMEDRFDQQTMELARFKSEHFNYMTDSSEKIRQMQSELDQQINYEYVKNVLKQYFMSNDSRVHAKLQTVVFTAMKFSAEEQQKVKEAFTANNTSYMGKIMGY